MSANPSRSDYVAELSHKHEFLIVMSFVLTLLVCICVIISTNAHKVHFLALALAVAVFYGTDFCGTLVKHVNNLTVIVNELTDCSQRSVITDAQLAEIVSRVAKQVKEQ